MSISLDKKYHANVKFPEADSFTVIMKENMPVLRIHSEVLGIKDYNICK